MKLKLNRKLHERNIEYVNFFGCYIRNESPIEEWRFDMKSSDEKHERFTGLNEAEMINIVKNDLLKVTKNREVRNMLEMIDGVYFVFTRILYDVNKKKELDTFYNDIDIISSMYYRMYRYLPYLDFCKDKEKEIYVENDNFKIYVKAWSEIIKLFLHYHENPSLIFGKIVKIVDKLEGDFVKNNFQIIKRIKGED